MMNIVIIGIPGSGKTSLGHEVAKKLGMEFVDTDDLIEQSEDRLISEIFVQDGEAYFRMLETVAIRTIADKSPLDCSGVIVSVGGGAAENAENVDLLRKIGMIVFIDRPLEKLEENIVYAGNRPLLSNRNDLREIYERRMPLYRSIADSILKNDGSFSAATEKLETIALLLGAKDRFLLIGDPVEHSLSPKLHQAIYEALSSGIGVESDAGILNDIVRQSSYGKVRVLSDGLSDAIKDILKGDVRGLNVTIPHKKSVIPYLNEVRGDAVLAGSVNTVVKENGNLIGYNTDMEGLSLAIEQCGRSYMGANVTVFGTGGAAVGVCVKAVISGAHAVNIIGRNKKSAEEIIALARAATMENSVVPSGGDDGTFARPAAVLSFDFAEHDFLKSDNESDHVELILSNTDILINATPLGMSGTGREFADLSFVDALPQSALVYDLVYDPVDTELVKAAKKRGIDTRSGLSMLIYQGILSDKYFFNMDIDAHTLYKTVSGAIGEIK